MWSHKFDYSPRHCYPGKDNRYYVNGSMDTVCIHPEQHEKRAGTTEFLRWIREFGELTNGIVTGFSDGWLKLGELPMTTAPYYMVSCYCENYGGVVKAFLNTKEGWAIVEIPDAHSELYSLADEAVELMKASYRFR